MSIKGSTELEYVRKPKASSNTTTTNAVNYLPPPGQTDEELSYYDQVVKRETKMEKLRNLSKKNPFVPLGCLITAGILLNGLLAMKRGDTAKSQRFMRYRVAAQGITILAVLGGTTVTSYFVE